MLRSLWFYSLTGIIIVFSSNFKSIYLNPSTSLFQAQLPPTQINHTGIFRQLFPDTIPPAVFKIDTILRIEQTGCYGKCEVYELNILNDGTTLWNGLLNTKLKGLFVSRLDRFEALEIMALASTNSILNGPENFPEKGGYIADFPNKKITIKSNSRIKNILINHSPPPEIKKLLSRVEFLISQLEWRSISN